MHNSAPGDSASSKIKYCTLNLIRNKIIINDLHLLVSFHEAFLYPHFKFLQNGEPQIKNSSSFIARHTTVRLFLVMEDLSNIENTWISIEKFDNYKQSLRGLSKSEQELYNNKITHFFRYVWDSILIHFIPWTKALLFLSLFLEQRTATCVTQMVKESDV